MGQEELALVSEPLIQMARHYRARGFAVRAADGLLGGGERRIGIGRVGFGVGAVDSDGWTLGPGVQRLKRTIPPVCFATCRFIPAGLDVEPSQANDQHTKGKEDLKRHMQEDFQKSKW